jgi:hypothetical protein
MRSVTSSRPLLLMFMVLPLPIFSRSEPRMRYWRPHDIGKRSADRRSSGPCSRFGGNASYILALGRWWSKSHRYWERMSLVLPWHRTITVDRVIA